MMRLSWTVLLMPLLAATLVPCVDAQQPNGTNVPSYAQQRGANSNQSVSTTQVGTAQAGTAQAGTARAGTAQAGTARAGTARANPATAATTAANSQPFPPLTDAQQQQLQQLLLAWQQQSQATRTLDCRFQRWHYDNQAAPAGVHATRADGVIKYAKPDKGLFRVDSLVYFKGMKEGKPEYGPEEGSFGEHWVCNGEQLIEFDRSQKQCKIQDLPPEMQGQQIFNSPLPFVFNLDAEEIQRRYWVRQVASPNESVVLIEAWPKRQDDRAQYKMVQIALDKTSFLPMALIMYAPNFHAKNAPRWDHYEFVDMKRNGVGNAIADFMQNFIRDRPPSDWKIFREKFAIEQDLPTQQANAPGQPTRR